MSPRADYLERRAGRMWAAIMEGNRAALEYLQDEAGMTRTGYHRGSGTESGRRAGQMGARPELGDRVVPAAHLP